MGGPQPVSKYMLKSTIVVGCPGSGKSTYLARIAKELDPKDTLILSYSRSAAATIAAKAGREYKSSTIHALCFRNLGIVPQQIMQGRQIDDFCKHIGIRPPWRGYERYDPTLHPYEVYNYALTTGGDPVDTYFRFADMAEFTLAEYIFFVKSLLEYKKVYGLFEFHDLLSNFNPTSAPSNLLVDEAQDNSYALTQALEKLVSSGVDRIWMVGDPNQAIYTYSGADPKWMYHFGGKEHFLEQSYRCPSQVVSLATAVLPARFLPRRIENFGLYKGKDGEGNRPDGGRDIDGKVTREISIPEDAGLILVRTNYIRYRLIQQTGIDQRKVMTIHKAKGMEANHVVLYNATTRMVRMSTELDPVAERRVIFTGITRAREKLTIVEGKVPNEWI